MGASGFTQAEFARWGAGLHDLGASGATATARGAGRRVVAPCFMELRVAVAVVSMTTTTAEGRPAKLSVMLPAGAVLRGTDPVSLAASTRAMRAK